MATGTHRLEYEVVVVVAVGAVRRLAPLTPRCFQKFLRRSG